MLAPPGLMRQGRQTVAAAATLPVSVKLRPDRADFPRSSTVKNRCQVVKNGFFCHTGSNGSMKWQVAARKQRPKFCPAPAKTSTRRKYLRGSQVLDSTGCGSTGHRQNILNADVTDFALVRGHGDIWVMMLGRSGC